jgi:tetratricopeptide (TPR) repeat protein/TolB-like protein
VAAGALGAVGVLALATRAVRPTRNGDLPLSERRVVVAPFMNESGDTSLAALGRMAADWAAQGLATTGVAEVVPASAAFSAVRYADSLVIRQGADRFRVLARETGARLVVSGSVHRVGDSAQLRAVIADGRDGRPIRALEPLTAPAGSPVAVVDLLRRRVLGALAPLLDARLATTAAVAGVPPSYEAYREFAEGMEQVTRIDFRAALPHFERAYALDTTYTRALLWVAISQTNLGRLGVADTSARAIARSRERLTPYDAAMLDGVRAWIDRDWPAAYDAAVRGARVAPGSLQAAQVGVEALRLSRPREAVRVLEGLDPSRGELRGYSGYWFILTEAYHLLGRHDDELRAARTIRAAYPDDPRFVATEARVLAALGRPADALALVDTRLAMPWRRPPAPDAMMLALAAELRAHGHAGAANAVWHRVIAWLDARDADTRGSRESRSHRGEALLALGRAAEARAIFAALAEGDSARPTDLRGLGVAAARAGDRAAAARAAARLAALRGRDEPVYAYWRAQIAAQLGDLAGATELLREALGRGFSLAASEFHAAPDLEPLREYPPFRALVQWRE